VFLVSYSSNQSDQNQQHSENLTQKSRHLQGTQSTMDTRLHDGGLFMQKLSELTMAKPEAAVQAGGTSKITKRKRERVDGNL